MTAPDRRSRTGDRLLAMSRRARGGVYRSAIGGSTTLLLTDPALVREALVAHGDQLSKGPGSASPWVRELLGNGVLTSEGDVHRRQRRLVAPAFSARRIREHTRRISALAERRVGRWTAGATIDVGAEMAGLTVGIATETLFGIELEDGRAGSLRRSLVAALEAYGRGPSAVDPIDHRAAELDDLVADIIADRSRPRADRDGPDVLSALLAATGPDDGTGLTMVEVRDCIVDLLLAGTETTASTLTWALYLIARDPSLEERLAMGAPGLLRATVAETLRLYPPAWLLARSVLEPFELGDRHLEAGTALLVSPWAMHRDPQWFPSPDTFDPHRWGPTVPAAYLPFGVGARSCIGEALARVEMDAVLAAVVRPRKLRLLSADPVPATFALTLRPATSILLEVRP